MQVHYSSGHVFVLVVIIGIYAKLQTATALLANNSTTHKFAVVVIITFWKLDLLLSERLVGTRKSPFHLPSFSILDGIDPITFAFAQNSVTKLFFNNISQLSGLSVDSQRTPGRHSADSRQTLGRLSADSYQTSSRLSVKTQHDTNLEMIQF